jgi:hypothetical protein
MEARASGALTACRLCKAIAMATVIIGCLSLPALAVPITYVLTDVTQGGDPLTGSFTVDESTFTLSAVDIFSSYYDVTFNIPVGVGASAIQVGNSSGQDQQLTFYDKLADSPDRIFPSNANYYPDGLNGPDYYMAFVYGDVYPTPLPAALPLFITGLGAIGLLGRRRKQKAQAAAA